MFPYQKSEHPLLVVLGPTASGKTRLAVELATKLSAEIISADSRQVFRGMNIGTGKDLAEYSRHEHVIPYHLIDIKAAGEYYHVNNFKEDFFAVYEDLQARNVLPIFCGGTGMYINSILQDHVYTAIPVNLDLRAMLADLTLLDLQLKLKSFPEAHTKHADQSTRKRLIRAIEIASFLAKNELPFTKRPVLDTYVVGLSDDVSLRRAKIAERLNKRLQEGMIEEVKDLIDSGVSKEMLKFYGLEYKIIVSFLDHQINYQELKEQLFNGICQYAKRQMTYFRKMEKDGVKIHWYQADMNIDNLSELILKDFKGQFYSNI